MNSAKWWVASASDDTPAQANRSLRRGSRSARAKKFSRLSIYLRATFLHARTFAAERARGGRWGPLRRLAYATAWPLIPLVRLRRVFRDLRRARSHGVLPRVLPPVLLGLTVSALGEATGYLLGPGHAPEKVSAYEFHRDRHVTRRDRVEMARTVPR
jgi:hypothetical protein